MTEPVDVWAPLRAIVAAFQALPQSVRIAIAAAGIEAPDGECHSCADPTIEGSEDAAPQGECASSPRPCGHHCNHSWSHDNCHWCGTEWGEE